MIAKLFLRPLEPHRVIFKRVAFRPSGLYHIERKGKFIFTRLNGTKDFVQLASYEGFYEPVAYIFDNHEPVRRFALLTDWEKCEKHLPKGTLGEFLLGEPTLDMFDTCNLINLKMDSNGEVYFPL